jgi:hypothetical protein
MPTLPTYSSLTSLDIGGFDDCTNVDLSSMWDFVRRNRNLVRLKIGLLDSTRQHAAALAPGPLGPKLTFLDLDLFVESDGVLPNLFEPACNAIPTLESLTLRGIPNAADLKCLTTLPSVSKLSFHSRLDEENVEDIAQAIAKMPKLQTVFIDGCDDHENFQTSPASFRRKALLVLQQAEEWRGARWA